MIIKKKIYFLEEYKKILDECGNILSPKINN